MQIFKKQNKGEGKSEKEGERFAREVLADGLKRISFADQEVFRKSKLYSLYMGNSAEAIRQKQELRENLLSLLPITSKWIEAYNEAKSKQNCIPESLTGVLGDYAKGIFLSIASKIEATNASISIRNNPFLNVTEGILNLSVASAFAVVSIAHANIALCLVSLFLVPDRLLVGWANLKFAFHKKTKDLVWGLKLDIENRYLDDMLKFYERINKPKIDENRQN